MPPLCSPPVGRADRNAGDAARDARQGRGLRPQPTAAAPRRALRQREVHPLRQASPRARPQGLRRLRRKAPRRREGPPREGQEKRPALRRPGPGALPPSRPRRRQAAAEGTARRRALHILRPPPSRRRPLRLRDMPRGTACTRSPTLCRQARRRLLRALHAAHGRGPVALRPMPRAGEGARVPRAGRAPSARNDMPPGAHEANVWTARRLSVAPPAVRDALTVPTPVRPSVTWWRSGRRRSL